MSSILNQLPNYTSFCDQIDILELPISSSELHGVMCGYLCAGASPAGEAYLRTLTINKRGDSARIAAQALFNVYTVSQQKMDEDNFSFEFLLPDDEQSISIRAQAFSEWCKGFTQSMLLVGVHPEQLFDEESQDAFVHLEEFSELDYESLQVNEEDEKALVEVSEYARMAVLRLYWDIKMNKNHHHQHVQGEQVKH